MGQKTANNGKPPARRLTEKQRKKQLKKTTTKAERAALKEERKEQEQKTVEVRQEEVREIKASLGEYGLSEVWEPIAKLYAVLDHYVATGEGGSGTIDFPEAPPQPHGRMIVYVLSNSRHQRAKVNLMVKNGQPYFQ